MIYDLKIEEDAANTVNEFLKTLLEEGKVDAVLAMQETPTGKFAFPTMVSDPDKLSTNVFTPLLPVSTGTIVSQMTKVSPPEGTLAVVLRSCEQRALTELAKLNQANLENVILIGVDCPGTFTMNAYKRLSEEEDLTQMVLKGEGEENMRTSCINCKDPVPEGTDMAIGIFGADTDKTLLLDVRTEKGDELVSEMGLKESKKADEREKAVEEIRQEKEEARKAFIEEKSDIQGIDKLVEFFDSCMNCHNCMKNCPICYCQECIFESPVFDLEGNKYMSKAQGKGAFKTPPDSLLFHITRFNHMMLSCVGCGLCEQACPSDIPLMDVITGVADNAQEVFEYLPGRDAEEELPLVVYREDEFQDVGEG